MVIDAVHERCFEDRVICRGKKKEERKEKEKGAKEMGLISAMTCCSSEDTVICTDKKGKGKTMTKKKKEKEKGGKEMGLGSAMTCCSRSAS